MKKKINFNDTIYLTMVFLYCFIKILANANISTIFTIDIASISLIINYCCIFFLIFTFVTRKKIGIKRLIFTFCITIVAGLVCLSVSDMSFFITYLFIICIPDNLEISRISKVMFRAYIINICLIFILFLLGISPDSILYQHGVIRHSLGFVSPNAFANIVTICLMLWIYTKNDNWKLKDILLGTVILFITYYYSNSRLALIIGLLDIVFTTITIKNNKVNELISNIIMSLSKYIMIILTILSLGITIYASKNFNNTLQNIDDFLTGRLQWSVYYYDKYDFNLFGQNILTVSKKQSLITGDKWQNVDNSYVSITIKYGYILIVSLCLIYFLLGKKLKKEQNINSSIYVLLICLIGITENFILISAYNLSIFMIGMLLKPEKRYLNEKK